jgi:diaminopropionate ammonia-lyase
VSRQNTASLIAITPQAVDKPVQHDIRAAILHFMAFLICYRVHEKGESADMNEIVPTFDPSPEKPLAFLKACPAYRATPLRKLLLADGHAVFAKDETARMGLNSFKALGAPYAIAREICARYAIKGQGSLSPDQLTGEAARAIAGNLTFVCASAGNHGLGVAFGARLVGAKARVHLSGTVPLSFKDRLLALGAEVVDSGLVYEDSMSAALADAAKPDHILLADSSWPGYWQHPALVMEGYSVIAEELRQQFCDLQEWPTHVFLQAGVGGLAAGLAVPIRKLWPVQPEIIIVEPIAAACLMQSHEAGEPIAALGPVSNMGRLDCKEPSLLAFNALEAAQVSYVLVSDDDADRACAMLSHGHAMLTTPSGAAGFAALLKLVGSIRTDFRPLVVITEGAV